MAMMASHTSNHIAVIIINYNTARLSLEAIASVLEKSIRRGVHIHLLDNASPHGDATLLETELMRRGWDGIVTLHAQDENIGFGRGNNVVFESIIASGQIPEYVFLLNPDARVENDVIDVLADFLDSNIDAKAVGARIEKPGGQPATSAFRFPGIISTFASSLSLGLVSRLLKRWQVPLDPQISSGKVDWVAGAAVMFRFDAIRNVNFFDPTYFLYYEEVDLMRRLSLNGGQIWYVAEAHVVHIEGASTEVRSGEVMRKRLPAYWYDSWRHYFVSNHGRAVALVAAGAWILGAVGNDMLSLLPGRSRNSPAEFYQDFFDMALRPLLGLKARRYG